MYVLSHLFEQIIILNEKLKKKNFINSMNVIENRIKSVNIGISNCDYYIVEYY